MRVDLLKQVDVYNSTVQVSKLTATETIQMLYSSTGLTTAKLNKTPHLTNKNWPNRWGLTPLLPQNGVKGKTKVSLKPLKLHPDCAHFNPSNNYSNISFWINQPNEITPTATHMDKTPNKVLFFLNTVRLLSYNCTTASLNCICWC